MFNQPNQFQKSANSWTDREQLQTKTKMEKSNLRSARGSGDESILYGIRS